MRLTPETRFWARVDRGDGSGCWLWTGPVPNTGYGMIFVNGRLTSAHRFSYCLNVGPIPDGLHLDHLCRVRRCVRPDHLEPVTPGENVLRGASPWAQNARKVQCPRGHKYDGVDHRGARICLTCEKALKAARDARYRLRRGHAPRRPTKSA